MLASLASGSVDAFVGEMNARAASMGLSNTVFEDVTGIVDGSRTTAEEVAQVALVAYQNPYYMAICNTISFEYFSSHKSQNIYNNNNRILHLKICKRKTIITKYYKSNCKWNK